MNNRRSIFFFSLLFVTGTSAFLFAMSRLEQASLDELNAPRGEISAQQQNPKVGRVTLTGLDGKLSHYPQRGKAKAVSLRPFLVKWPTISPRGQLTFHDDDQEVHLEVELSQPYYDPGRRLATFTIRSKQDLNAFHRVEDVHLYISR